MTSFGRAERHSSPRRDWSVYNWTRRRRARTRNPGYYDVIGDASDVITSEVGQRASTGRALIGQDIYSYRLLLAGRAGSVGGVDG